MTFSAVGLVHLIQAVVSLLVLGLVMAFSPTTFAIEVGTIERTPQPRTRVLAIAGGVALAATVLALALTAVTPAALHTLWTGRVQPLIAQRWFEAVVGVAMIGAGVWEWRRALRPRVRRSPSARLNRPQVLLLVVFANSLISTTGPATMYLVVHTISRFPAAVWLLGYAVFLVGLSAPYFGLAIGLSRDSRVARKLAAATAAVERWDLRRPAALALIVVGLAITVWSVVELLTAHAATN